MYSTFDDFVNLHYIKYISALFNKGGDEARSVLFQAMSLINEQVKTVPVMGSADNELYSDFGQFVQNAHNECMITLLENGSKQMKLRFKIWLSISSKFGSRGK